MSDVPREQVMGSDAELIAAVRAGDNAAFGDLFGRHRMAAVRLANQLMPGPDADDLVSEAFIKVLGQLQDGRGPDLAFRAYLLTAIRRLHIDRVRANTRVRVTDEQKDLDQGVEFVDTASANFEQGAAATAFASLPERWQLVLWHLDVEGQKPADVAPLLAMSANSVSALAYRAREGLRQAYLQRHLADTADKDCRWTTEHLGAHVRKGLSNRDANRVETHLDGCRRCMGIYLELCEVNSRLGALLAPALLGSVAAGYLAAGAGTGAAISAGSSLLGAKALIASGGKLLVEPAKAVIAGAGAQGVAAVAVVATVTTAGAVTVAKGEFSAPANTVTQQVVPIPPPPDTPQPSESVPPPSAEPTIPTAQPTAQPTALPTTEPELVQPFRTPQTVPPPVELPTATPAPPPDPEPSGPPTAPPPPQPNPAPIVPTDLGIGAITISNDSTLLQRRITVPVTSHTDDSHTDGTAKTLNVSLTFDFGGWIRFRGVVSPGWECGTVRNTFINAMTCTRAQTGPKVPSLVFKAQSLFPRATLTVDAADNADPVAQNNSSEFRSGIWPFC